jgi:hypothetical protein
MPLGDKTKSADGNGGFFSFDLTGELIMDWKNALKAVGEWAISHTAWDLLRIILEISVIPVLVAIAGFFYDHFFAGKTGLDALTAAVGIFTVFLWLLIAILALAVVVGHFLHQATAGSTTEAINPDDRNFFLGAWTANRLKGGPARFVFHQDGTIERFKPNGALEMQGTWEYAFGEARIKWARGGVLIFRCYPSGAVWRWPYSGLPLLPRRGATQATKELPTASASTPPPKSPN